MPEVSTSRHGQWLNYCAERIRTGKLSSMADTSVLVRKQPWNRNMTKPGCFVTLANVTRNDANLGGILATNTSIVYGYGAQITLIRASNEELALDDEWLLWRERAEALFEPKYGNPAAAGVAWVDDVVIEPGPPISVEAFNLGFDVQAFIARAIGRRRRGEAA